MTERQIKNWLDKHAGDLEPEEILFEEEKMKVAQEFAPVDGSWPIPRELQNLDVFSKISSEEEFNRVVGNPDNWAAIFNDCDLYNQWILPNAVLLFGKTWFDRVKWRPSIHRSVPFPLFTTDEKGSASLSGKKLEDTSYGKARIAKIIAKVSSVLEVYLAGKWREKTNYMKKPGGYIIDSIKNEVVREIGADLGYKLVPTLACPYCLASNKISYKTPLIRHAFKQYSCPRCTDLTKNLWLEISNVRERGDVTTHIEKQFERVKRFKYFIGITCVCPNDKCDGKFVPLTCVNWDYFDRTKHNITGVLKNFSVTRDIQSFKQPPQSLENFPLTCPFCTTKFTPKSALNSKSGFKKKSGHFTGLPTVSIWIKKEINTLDELIYYESFDTSKDRITAKHEDLGGRIGSKQRINLLIDELVIHMARINRRSVTGLMSWYFYEAAISWMNKYWQDASGYFFGWSEYERDMTVKEMIRNPGKTKKKMTNTHRGLEVPIHFSFFQEWLGIIEKNINEICVVRSNIKELKDLKWFCRRPKFSGGPKSTFTSEVDSRKCIVNKTRVRCEQTPYTNVPRLVKIYAIYRIINDIADKEYNYIKEIDVCEWQSIKLLSNSSLKEGDKVKVEALIMSGHPTHAPIQRIIRLRSVVLKNIIDRIRREELTGDTDFLFWEAWKKRVVASRLKIKETF
jgi:hypothetical protein